MQLIEYLKGTKNIKLQFNGNATKGSSDIVRYCDADWASYEEERWSACGYTFLKNGTKISWSTNRQPPIALYTTEAEYMAMSTAAQGHLYLREYSAT